MTPTTLNLPLLSDVSLPHPAPVLPASFFAAPSPNPSTVLTPVVKKAEELIKATLPNWAVNHCYRVYAFGLALAEHAGWTKAVDWDIEVWFLAALLHDIGWAPHSECCDHSGEREATVLSFEIWGGIKARELLLEWGAPRRCADTVCEAIIRHTEGRSDSGKVTLVTGLLQLGPSHDFRAVLHEPVESPSIDPQTTANIIELYPRLGLIYHFHDTMTKELQAKPGCMAQFWAPRVLSKVGSITDFGLVQGSKEDGEAKAPEGAPWLSLK